MSPQLIVRAYRRTWVVVQLGIQGPIRIRRARQRNRFLAWLYAWAERGCSPLIIEMRPQS
jgi:hypothetical protein